MTYKRKISIAGGTCAIMTLIPMVLHMGGIRTNQAGVISPLEGRMALQDNKKSGFTRFEAIEPISTPGMSPENVIKLTQTQGKALEDQSQAMLKLTQAQHDPRPDQS